MRKRWWQVVKKRPPEPDEPRDWMMTILIGGCVIWIAALTGKVLADFLWP